MRAGKWMLPCVLAIVVLSLLGWMKLRVDTSLEPLLPENSDARQTLEFVRDSSFAAKAILWFRLAQDPPTGLQKHPESPDLSDLVKAADQAVGRLDPALVTRVIQPPRESEAMGEVVGFLDNAGELLNQGDMAEISRMIEHVPGAAAPDPLKKRMRECYMQLVKPEGSFLQQIIRRDPLGVNTRVLSRLYDLTKGMGYKVEIKNGHFVHPDGRQLMVILETSSSATSLVGSEQLTAHLRDLCARAPPGILITPICGQIHTEQNHHVMEADMKRATVIDGVAFFLLFILVCRDWRVGAVFGLPIITVLLTIGLCGLVYAKISMVVIGMSATMAGSAVDYGIFVYTAVWLGSDVSADIRDIRKPLIVSHLTTLGVFVAFLFSNIPAYRQLGVLTSVSLVLSLLGALYALPLLIKPGGKIMAIRPGMPLERWGRLMLPAAIAGAILLACGMFLAARVGFDYDFTRLDGISGEVRRNEADFQRTWVRGDRDMAILVVSGATREAAEEANDRIAQRVGGKITDGQFVSLSAFWPSGATRNANQERWNRFWSSERVEDVRRKLAAAGEPYGFSAHAFDPFFQSLNAPADPDRRPNRILSSVQEQFVARSGNNWQMLNYFEDSEANTTAVRALVKDSPEAQVVSKRTLGQAFAESAVSETHVLISVSVVFIVGSLLVLTRSVIKSLIIMLPVLTGIVCMLAVMSMMSMSMNVVTVVAAILVLALGSDYGVFALYAWERGETTLGQGMAAVHLSSITTVVGTGAMLFAGHPAMFLVGVTMTSGLFASYLTAFLMIPCVCGWLKLPVKARNG